MSDLRFRVRIELCAMGLEHDQAGILSRVARRPITAVEDLTEDECRLVLRALWARRRVP